jgi:predicted phage terminase large subunit-like protein
MKQPSPHLIENVVHNRKIRAEVCRKSHEWFFTVYFPHYIKYASAPFHEEFFALTEDESVKLLCCVAFRGSGKSTIFTTSYALWSILGVQQKKFAVIFCQTRGQAKQVMMNLRQELESNDLLKLDLGPFQEERDTEWGSGSLVFARSGARITVASVEQSIRGLRHREHRPDLIVCDDVEDLASTKTQEGRDKTYQWFTGEVIPAGSANTKIIVVGNLLHDDSLLMRLKADIASEKRNGVFREYPLIDAKGMVLWPGKYPDAASIEEQKKVVGSESAWQREYLLRIITDDDQVIRPEWITYYDALPNDGIASDYRLTATGVDLAISEKESADYTAMVSAKVFGRGQNLRIFILPNPVNERLDFPETVKRVTAISRALGNGSYSKLFIEDVGYQRSLIQQLRDENVPAEEFKTLGNDKRSRLTLTTNAIQSGRVLFPREGVSLLVRQLVGFGKEKHDDLADAFSIVINKILAADTGQFFGEWNYERHVVAPRAIPSAWFQFRGIHAVPRNGYTAALWIALDCHGDVWVYKEYYATGRDSDEHADAIKRLSENEDHNYKWCMINDDIAGKPGFAESTKEVYEKRIENLYTAKQEASMGLDAVHQRLRFDMQNPPKIKISSDCVHLIRALSSAVCDSKNPNDIERNYEAALIDALRYVVQTMRDWKTPAPLTVAERRLKELFGQNSTLDFSYRRHSYADD